jgi:hypothetical protein
MQPTFDQAYQALNLVRESGASLETLQTVYNLGFFSDLLKAKDLTAVDREAFRKLLGYDPSVFPVKMGGPENTDAIVAALRESGIWVNDHITQANFPLTARKTPVEDEIQIIDPGKSFSEEEGLVILKEAKLIRPTYEHGIRFAQQHGKVTTSKEKPFVIFLHPSWRGPLDGRRVLYVYRNPGNRRLILNYPDNRFNDNCVLAGVRSRNPLRFNPALAFRGRVRLWVRLAAPIRRAFCQFHPTVPKMRCILGYRTI